MTEVIHVVLASDDHYAQHMGVVVLSLLTTSTNPERVFFHLLDAGISPANRNKILDLIVPFHARYEFIVPDARAYQDFPLKRYGIASFFRLSLDTILPALDRVIYLDCDLVLFDDIANLWRLSLQGKPLAAVESLGDPHITRLGLNKRNVYFNAGVLMIDLAQWRQEKLGEVTLDYMRRHKEELIYPDQDGLNVVLQGRWQKLPLRWNHQPAVYSMLRKTDRRFSQRRKEFEETICRPGIVHYLGGSKPWRYMKFHPLKETYWYYLSKTPWRNYMYPDKSWGNRIKKLFMLEKRSKHWRRKRRTPASWRCGV